MFPRHILKISITPNWISLIPNEIAIGKKIGVKMRMAGVMSINIPTISNIIFISKKMINRFSVSESKPSDIASGIPA